MFWTVFSNLCANANISPNAVATELKIPSGSITAWHNGAIPRTKSLTKIANYFDVTPDYLLHGDEQTKKPTAQGGELISDLPENIQELISICLQNPDFTVLLLNLAQRMQNPPADQA